MANSVIGALRVNLGLDSAKFISGAKAAETRSAKLGRALGRIAVGGLAAAAGLLAVSRRAAENIDRQAKLAQSLGTTTASIQVLSRAGDLAGVSLGEIEQATQQLTRRLSQAASGTGPAVAGLAALKLSVDDLNAVPLDERIRLIQERLQEFVPASQQAAVAAQLFGDRAGLVFTRIDPATLAQARQELERFNVTVTDVEADQIERTNDALSQLGLIGQGLANRLAAALAPALERVANTIVTLTERGTLFSTVLFGLVQNIDLIIAAVGVLAGLLTAKLAIGLASTVLAFIGLTGPVGLLVGLFVTLGAGALILVERFGKQETASYDAQAGTVALNAALGTFAQTAGPNAARSAIEVANANYQLAASSVDAAKAELAKAQAFASAAAATNNDPRASRNLNARAEGGVNNAQSALAAAEAALAQATNDRTRAVTAVTGATSFLVETQDALNESLEVTVDTTGNLGGSLGGAAAGASQLATEVELATVALEESNSKADELNSTLGSVFGDALLGVTSLREGLAQFLSQLASGIANKAFTDLFSGLGGGGGGGLGGFLTSILPGFATGTNNFSGGLAMVGERGKELVSMPQGSKVFDAQKTKSILSGAGAAPVVNVPPAQIIFVDDPRKIGDYLASPEGERQIARASNRSGGR
jgi:hypothetical protein